jgi:transcriptional regulator with XRE-family HTH domain
MELELGKIGENIRIARNIKGFSQEGLANKLNKSQNWMQKVEKGEIDLSITCIRNIANELEVPASFILYSTPAQVINNCTIGNNAQSFNNCIFNSESLFEKLINSIEVLNSKL